MGRLVSVFFLLTSLSLLLGCPAKDWMKREDSYLSVEQYKTMTRVIRINDNLYRVKKGEELNQNKITQLFINLQQYIDMDKAARKKQLVAIKSKYKSEKSMFNTMAYVLVLLETQANKSKAYRILSRLDNSTLSSNDRNLLNLSKILHVLLKSNKKLKRSNTKLSHKLSTLNKEYVLVQEKILSLNEKVNALKSIEDNIHSREVLMELESR